MIKTSFMARVTCWKHHAKAELVVHQCLECCEGWTVSHIGTGMMIIPKCIESRDAATRLAEWAESEADWAAIDWPGPTDLGIRICEKVLELTTEPEAAE